MTSDQSRRDFLRTTALAGVGAAVGADSTDAHPRTREPANLRAHAPAHARTGAPARPSWVDRPMRWAQLTLAENDPGTYDPTFWPDYFRRTRADAVCLSAGGCVAYYPTAVAWATNEPPVVRITGPGVLDVTAWRQVRSMTVHLVNLTNPMMMKGPIREPLIVGPHVVRVRLRGERAGRVRLLVANAIVQPRRSGEWIEVTVPSIVEHEVVAIEL